MVLPYPPSKACLSPKYLAGSSGGQAGGHVSLWVSRASMSLSRSVCTSAPATANEDEHREACEEIESQCPPQLPAQRAQGMS